MAAGQVPSGGSWGGAGGAAHLMSGYALELHHGANEKQQGRPVVFCPGWGRGVAGWEHSVCYWAELVYDGWVDLGEEPGNVQGGACPGGGGELVGTGIFSC